MPRPYQNTPTLIKHPWKPPVSRVSGYSSNTQAVQWLCKVSWCRNSSCVLLREAQVWVMLFVWNLTRVSTNTLILLHVLCVYVVCVGVGWCMRRVCAAASSLHTYTSPPCCNGWDCKGCRVYASLLLQRTYSPVKLYPSPLYVPWSFTLLSFLLLSLSPLPPSCLPPRSRPPEPKVDKGFKFMLSCL